MHKRCIFFAIFLCNVSCIKTIPIPKLTIIIVIDQCSYYYFPKLLPYFKYGLKELASQGIFYTNAYMPHGMPATAVGHAALNTGAYPKDHGFIGNQWVDKATGKAIQCDEDLTGNTMLIDPVTNNPSAGLKSRSPMRLMVDGISDQFMLNPSKMRQRCFSLSHKSRSGIATAGKLGTAIWFDHAQGLFTSSTAYLKQLPDWVMDFNKNYVYKKLQWHLMYPSESEAYHMNNQGSYNYVDGKKSAINQVCDVHTAPKGKKGAYHCFMLTPHAPAQLLQLAKECIALHVDKNNDDRMLLWLCISSLDPVGHAFGPDSKEAIDLLYHIDKQLGNFIEHVHTTLGKGNVLWGLSADHGVSPIVELVKEKGYTTAQRIMSDTLIKKINAHLQKKYNKRNLIFSFQSPQFYVNHEIFDQFSELDQQAILDDTSAFLAKQTGIKRVWKTHDLMNETFLPTDLEYYFKQQIYPGRSGEITVQTDPYVLISKNQYGTAHETPYDYDTHVPLILYQPGVLNPAIIIEKVWTLQLANTLAYLLGTAKPSASTVPMLPGIEKAIKIDENPQAEMTIPLIDSDEIDASFLPEENTP